MDKIDQSDMKLEEFELEPVPDSVNDDYYDGVIHISTRGRQPKYRDRKVSKRSAFQTFTFD